MTERPKDLRRNQIDYNPCMKEQNLTLKCLDDNGYMQEFCVPYFENYKTCKKFWAYVVKDRKRNGIDPALPRPEDRQQVKEDYLKRPYIS